MAKRQRRNYYHSRYDLTEGIVGLVVMFIGQIAVMKLYFWLAQQLTQ